MSSELIPSVYGPQPSQLRCAKLTELCLSGGVQTGPFGSQLHQKDYVLEGIPIITVEHLGENQIVHNDLPRVSEADRQRLEKYSLKAGDIVFSRVGSVDRRALVKESEEGWLFSGRCLRVRPNPEIIDSQWLSYFFGLPSFKSYIRGIAVGATMPSLNTKILSDVPIYFPPIDSQRQAARMLGSLDDRITLLRETNKTLESIAQAIFKSWFVDFDPVHSKAKGLAPQGMDEATAALFPDSFEESELGMVPKEWKIGTLSDLCLKIESGGTPKRTNPDYWAGSVKWLTSGEVRNRIVLETKEHITELGVQNSSAKLWPAGTTVIAMYGATAGEVCMIVEKMSANQACCGLIPHEEFRTFVFLKSSRESKNLASKSSGSAQQNLSKGLIESHPSIIPSSSVGAIFESVTGPLLDRWIESHHQIRNLSSLRDTLLPRLISGELRIEEAQEMVESV